MTLKRQDLRIILALALFFVCISAPGIGWGTPDYWHPDELAKNVDKQINGIRKIDAAYFNHPFLPPNIMQVIGEVLYHLNFSRTVFILTVRFINLLFAAGIVILVYLLTRLLGGGVIAAVVGACLVISSSEIAVNARIAHDDIPLAFFTTLAVLFLVQFRKTRKNSWLFSAFFTIGLATASKYNGASLILVPLVLIVWDHRSEIRLWDFRGLGSILLGAGLALAGFGLGSPQVFIYFRRFLDVIGTTLLHHAEFNVSPNSELGLFGQWSVLYSLLGAPVFFLSIIATLYELIGLVSKGSALKDFRQDHNPISVILLSILALNLPMLAVRHYPARFYVTLIPLLSVLVGLLIEDLYLFVKKRYTIQASYAVIGLAAAIVAFSLMRVLSIGLLFFNDARIAASDYIVSLPARASVEYTVYSPSIPDHYFKRKRNYPLFFPKSLMTGVPGDAAAKDVNSGEAGLEKRAPDFLIVDSFTYDRFSDPYTCQQVPVECAFFQRLLADETNYKIERIFEYRLPGYLPQLAPFFLNPTIRIYRRGS